MYFYIGHAANLKEVGSDNVPTAHSTQHIVVLRSDISFLTDG